MNRKELLTLLLEGLDIETPGITEETLLKDLMFDSIAMLGVLSVMDYNCGVKVSSKALRDCKTIKDILDLGIPN